MQSPILWSSRDLAKDVPSINCFGSCLLISWFFFFTGEGEGNIVDSLIPLLWALGFVELPEIRKQAAKHTQTHSRTRRLTDRQRKSAHTQSKTGWLCSKVCMNGTKGECGLQGPDNQLWEGSMCARARRVTRTLSTTSDRQLWILQSLKSRKQNKGRCSSASTKSVSQSRRQLLGNLNATSAQDRSPLGSEDCHLEHLEELPKSGMRIQVVCGLGNRGLCYPVLFQFSTVDLDGPWLHSGYGMLACANVSVCL